MAQQDCVLCTQTEPGMLYPCAEIGGGWLVWQTIRNKKPWYYIVAGNKHSQRHIHAHSLSAGKHSVLVFIAAKEGSVGRYGTLISLQLQLPQPRC